MTYYKSVADGLYGLIVNMCAVPGKMCMNEMMRIDAAGGAGPESHENREKLHTTTATSARATSRRAPPLRPRTGRPAARSSPRA